MIRTLLSLSLLLTAFSAANSKRPNILYIMSDDHAAAGISAYGSRFAEIAPTPNIDRLANEGILFENAFCTNSICSPSRACVLTGQYNHTNGVFDLWGKVDPGKQTLAMEMGKAGYQTAMIGKWHLKVEPADFEYYCVLPGQGKYHGPSFRLRGEKKWPNNMIHFPEKHSTDAITDLTLDWLKDGWDKERPFFLMHHYKAPHDYFKNADRYEDFLKGVDIPAPESLWNSHPTSYGSMATRGHNDELIPHIGTSVGPRNPRRSYHVDLPKLFPAEYPENFDPKNYSNKDLKRMAYNAYLRKFLRCIKGIDDNLGRLFAHLEATGQLDNTVIIYTGDQGFMLGEHDYQDKRWMLDESMRMPFLVRYPKTIKAGTRSDAMIENVDYAATMLDFAGIKTPDSIQGRSFKSICETGNEPKDWKQESYYRYWMHMAHHDNPGHVGIRTKTHKLIYYYGCDYEGGYRTPPGWELYDLVKDPKETVNLADNPKYARILISMKKRLAETRKRVGDDGSHYPKCETVLQEFWDYSTADREKAKKISGEFLKTRLDELAKRDAKKKN